MDAGTVLGAMVGRLATWLRRVRAGQHAAVRTRWQQLAVGATGAPVEVAHPGGVRRGVTCGIDAGGALLVRHGGETERVVGGEVTWL